MSLPPRVPFPVLLLFLALGTACADTTAPLPPPDEVVLVVNSTESSLTMIPVHNPGAASTIPLGGTTPTPTTVAARGAWAVVPLGLDNTVAVVDLQTQRVTRRIGLPAGSGATGAAMVDDSIAYVANPNLNTVTRVNYLTGDTASVAAGVYPQGVVYTRGKVFVLNGNLVQFAPAGPSWISVIDPGTNAPAEDVDSIPLPGPGNAGFATVGPDGLLYVMSSGSYVQGEGRLSIVDPVGRKELASFSGFGTAPGSMATDGGDLLYISSFSEGLMEFDIHTRTVILGAGDGVNIPGNSSVAVDSDGRIYAISTGPCQGGVGGTAHILRSDLTESASVTLGECSIAATVTMVPPS